MSKFFGKILIVLITTMVLSTSVSPTLSHAESTIKDPVVVENSKKRIAITKENGVVTKAVFDKTTNILTIKENGKEPIIIDLNKTSEEYIANETIKTDVSNTQSNLISAYSLWTPTTKQDTFINYEYTITHSSPEKWQLRRPNGDSLYRYYYKNVTRTSSNGSDLLKFQGYVENIDYYEWKAIGGSLTTLGMSWLSFILSVPTAGAGTLTTGLAALGAYGATLDALVQVHKNANLARGVYFSL